MLTWIHSACSPSVTCPICKTLAQCQPRRTLDCTYSLLDTPLAWPWLTPTWKTLGPCPSTPSHLDSKALACCLLGISVDCTPLALTVLPVWSWLATTKETPQPMPCTRIPQLMSAQPPAIQPRPADSSLPRGFSLRGHTFKTGGGSLFT